MMRPRGWSKNTKNGFTPFLLLLLLMPWFTLTGSSLSEAQSRFKTSSYQSTDQSTTRRPSPSGRISASYESHPPITIDGNADFMAQATAGNWSGDGTPSTPYIIEGLNITGPLNTTLIRISNTDVFFRIIDCSLDGGNDGINLENTRNGEISGNIVTNNSRTGILAYKFSNNNIFSGNIVTNSSGKGIILTSSWNNTISGNTVTNNGEVGISLTL